MNCTFEESVVDELHVRRKCSRWIARLKKTSMNCKFGENVVDESVAFWYWLMIFIFEFKFRGILLLAIKMILTGELLWSHHHIAKFLAGIWPPPQCTPLYSSAFANSSRPTPAPTHSVYPPSTGAPIANDFWCSAILSTYLTHHTLWDPQFLRKVSQLINFSWLKKSSCSYFHSRCLQLRTANPANGGSASPRGNSWTSR